MKRGLNRRARKWAPLVSAPRRRTREAPPANQLHKRKGWVEISTSYNFKRTEVRLTGAPGSRCPPVPFSDSSSRPALICALWHPNYSRMFQWRRRVISIEIVSMKLNGALLDAMYLSIRSMMRGTRESISLTRLCYFPTISLSELPFARLWCPQFLSQQRFRPGWHSDRFILSAFHFLFKSSVFR